jgi:cytochrome c oxidase subunit 2
VRTKTNLGPGFWPVTALIAVGSAIMTYFVYASAWPIGLPQIAEPAGQIDEEFKFLGAVGGTIFNIVTGYVIYFAIVFRRPKNAPPNHIGVQIHDAPILEFWWTVIPTILVLILAIFSVKIWAGLQNQAGDVLTMEAIGYQFGFEFRYPHMSDPVMDEMHVPVNTPITLHLTSRDVNHGFWVPEVRLKMDMVPGLINTIRFTPTQIGGPYRIICTEFCGIAHGTMRSKFYIDSQQDFAKWFSAHAGGKGVAGSSAPGAAIALDQGRVDAGQQLFGQKCSACHSVGPFSQKIVGPGLGTIFSDTDHPKLVNGTDPTPQNIAMILKNGYQGDIGVMPSAQVNAISNSDIANLVAYLVSLSKK